jgi:hypothetical protein
MSVSLEMVAEALKKYAPEMHLSMKDHFIETAIMLNHPQASFEPEILYIGKASDLEKIPTRRSPINLLCVYDSPILQEYNECSWLNLITVSNQVNAASLYKEVKDLLIARRQYDQASHKLFDSLVSGRGLQHILDTGYEILGNPLLIFDSALKLLGYSKGVEVNDALWQETIKNGYTPLEATKELHSLEEIKLIAESSIPTFDNYVPKYKTLENRITINDIFVGIVALFEYEKPIEEKDAEILQLFCRVVSCEMQKEDFFSHTQGATYEFLIADLLEGRIPNAAVAHERIASLALDFKEYLYLLVIRYVKDSTGNPALFFLRSLLENTISGSRSVLYKDNIVLLIGREKEKPLTETERESVTNILKENHMLGGLSRCFHDVAGIQEYYRQASKAIELGKRLNKEKEAVLFSYDEYAFYHLMDIAGSQQDLESFCDPLVFALIEYDQKNNTDLTRSLYDYLSSGNNLKESAFVLGIHRNTLDYRIKKIEEILNVNIEDPNVSWSLYLSFKVFELTGNTNFLQGGK